MNHRLQKNETEMTAQASYSMPVISVVATGHTVLYSPVAGPLGNDNTLVEAAKFASKIAFELLNLSDQPKNWLQWLQFTNSVAAVLAFPNSKIIAATPTKSKPQPSGELVIAAVYTTGAPLDHLIGQRLKLAEFPPCDLLKLLPASDTQLTSHPIYKDGILVLVTPKVLCAACAPPYEWLDVFNAAIEKNFERQTLEKEKQAASDLSLAKTRFLSMMSYEIRTPMNAIMGMTELLLDTDLNSEQREFAQITYDSSEALLQILGDVVDYAKLESSGLDMDYAPFAPKDTVTGTLKMLNDKVQSKGLLLNPGFAFGLPPLVFGDAGRLRQLLLNLIVSIIKFTNTGSIIIRVSQVEASANSSTLRFDLRSPNAEIPESMHDLLFSPFSIRETAVSRQYIGVRLALSVAAKLAERMKGELHMEALQPAGWTFWFTAKFGL